MGTDARISSPFSEIKLSATSSCDVFVGENKCLDQGAVLLHGGEDEAGENIILFCAPCKVSRSNRTYSMVPRTGHLLSRRFPSSLVSPVVTGTFPFARKFASTSSLEIKRFISKFHLPSAM